MYWDGSDIILAKYPELKNEIELIDQYFQAVGYKKEEIFELPQASRLTGISQDTLERISNRAVKQGLLTQICKLVCPIQKDTVCESASPLKFPLTYHCDLCEKDHEFTKNDVITSYRLNIGPLIPDKIPQERSESDQRTKDEDIKIQITVLLLSADPTDESRLRLDKEFSEIEDQLEAAQLRDRFKIEKKGAIQPKIVTKAILKFKPQIVHFSGHGTSSGELCWENEVGESLTVKPEALARLFKLVSDHVNCVILNTCFSSIQAEAISNYIDYVIGSSEELDDNDAISFAVGFYQALGEGKTIEQAYEFGCVQIGLCDAESEMPALLKKRKTKR